MMTLKFSSWFVCVERALFYCLCVVVFSFLRFNTHEALKALEFCASMPVSEAPALQEAELVFCAQQHEVANLVLSGSHGAPGEFVQCWRVRIDDAEYSVRFDGCSQRSGKQRAWVRCPHTAHAPCFKYKQIDKFPDELQCVAWLAAWAHGAKRAAVDQAFDKQAHNEFVPAEDVVTQALESGILLE
jgi:hypothetical protein